MKNRKGRLVGRQGVKRSTRPSQTNNPGLGGDVRNWEQLMAHSPKYFLPISSRWRSRRPLWGAEIPKTAKCDKMVFFSSVGYYIQLSSVQEKHEVFHTDPVNCCCLKFYRSENCWHLTCRLFPPPLLAFDCTILQKVQTLFWNTAQCIWSKLIQLKGLQLQDKSLNWRYASEYWEVVGILFSVCGKKCFIDKTFAFSLEPAVLSHLHPHQTFSLYSQWWCQGAHALDAAISNPGDLDPTSNHQKHVADHVLLEEKIYKKHEGHQE